MRPIDKAQELMERAEEFALLLSESVPEWSELLAEGLEAVGQFVIEREGQAFMRVGYAMREMITAIHKANELATTCAQLWPNESKAAKEILKRATLRGVSAKFIDKLSDEWRALMILSNERFLFEIAQVIEHPDDQHEPTAKTKSAIFEGICRLRDSTAFRRLSEGHSVKGHLPPWLMELDFPPDEFAELESWLRLYRLENLIYSWVKIDNNNFREIYPFLFSFSKQGQGKTMAFDLVDCVPPLLDQVDLPSLELENVTAILTRLSQVASEVGYDHILDSVLASAGGGGSDSLIGNTRPINFIPSDEKTACCPVVVAMAKGRGRRSAISLAATIRNIKTHLIECADLARFVIFFTDTWDSTEFVSEHFAEFAAHHRRGVRFLLILAGATPFTLTPIPIDFGKRP